MKKIMCSAMGGPADCDTIIMGNTPEEMTMNGMKHIEESHPELAADIKKMTPEETTKWMDDFKAKFDTLEDA